MPGISASRLTIPLHSVSNSVTFRLVSSGDIVYRRRRQGGVLYIDYSDNGGLTWELAIAQFLLAEDVIEVTIDDSPVGYRDVVRDGAYKIDQLLVGGSGDWDIEGTDWENIASISGSSYWTPQSPLGGETPSFWYKEGTRNELTLPDSVSPVTGDASILPSYFYKPTGTEYLSVTDGTGLDIGSNDFTLWAKAKCEGTDKTTYRLIAGKLLANGSGKVGNYYFIMDQTTGYLRATIQDSVTGFLPITSNIDFTTAGWVTLRLDVNVATKKFRFFINNVQVGVDASYAGTIPSPTLKFGIGASGDGGLKGKSSHSDTFILHRLMTPTEAASAELGVYPSDCAGFWPCVGGNVNYEYDTQGNYNLTCVSTTTAKVGYGATGSRYLLDNGWSLYRKLIAGVWTYERVPYGGVTTTLEAAGYTLVKTYSGSTTNHNLAPSKIQFAHATWDRSDTNIWNALARGTDYDATSAATKKQWHIDKLNQDIINDWLVTAKKDVGFVKMTTDSINVRTTLKEIFSYATAKTGSDLTKALSYTGDSRDDFFEYYFTSGSQIHYCATRDNKILAFDDIGTLYLSLDGGTTFPISKSIQADCTYIEFAHIWENGNITFCGHRKVFVSTDSLSTYSQITVKDRDGNNFTPATDGNFSNPTYQNINIGGTEHLVWGAISMVVGVMYSCNVWHSNDNGLTLNSIYLSTTDLPAIEPERHFHSCNFNPTDNSLWLCTGDGALAKVNCHVIKGVYNSGTKSWDTWSAVLSGVIASYAFRSGLVFYDGYVYWTGCSSSATHKGVWRCLYEDIDDDTKYIRLLTSTADEIIHLHDGGNGKMMCIPYPTVSKNVIVCKNGLDFELRALQGGPDFTTGSYFLWSQPNSDGYWLCGIMEDDETQTPVTYHAKVCAMVKFDK